MCLPSSVTLALPRTRSIPVESLPCLARSSAPGSAGEPSCATRQTRLTRFLIDQSVTDVYYCSSGVVSFHAAGFICDACFIAGVVFVWRWLKLLTCLFLWHAVSYYWRLAVLCYKGGCFYSTTATNCHVPGCRLASYCANDEILRITLNFRSLLCPDGASCQLWGGILGWSRLRWTMSSFGSARQMRQRWSAQFSTRSKLLESLVPVRGQLQVLQAPCR